MEHFLTYSDNTDNFADKIIINQYTQGENETKINTTVLKSKNILEIVLSVKDYNYQILDKSEKSEYVKKKSLELSTFLDLYYDNYNYNKKKFDKNNVCNALQHENKLSSILFYNDYYGINIVICNQLHDTLKLYKTGVHPNNKDFIYIKYSQNNFTLIESTPETIIPDFDQESYIFSDPFELHGDVKDPHYTLKIIIDIDIKDNMIYKSSLKPITSYKSDELINLAKENNINIIKSNGKKYNKKEIYDILNIQLLCTN